MVARANVAPAVWAVAVGGDPAPDAARVVKASNNQRAGELNYSVRLEPGAERSWTFAVVVKTEAGATAALRHLDEWMPQRETLLAEKPALYDALLNDGPRFHSPDPDFDAAFDLAREHATARSGIAGAGALLLCRAGEFPVLVQQRQRVQRARSDGGRAGDADAKRCPRRCAVSAGGPRAATRFRPLAKSSGRATRRRRRCG